MRTPILRRIGVLLASIAAAGCSGGADLERDRLHAEIVRAMTAVPPDDPGTARPAAGAKLDTLLTSPVYPAGSTRSAVARSFGGLAIRGGDLLVAEGQSVWRLRDGSLRLVTALGGTAEPSSRGPVAIAFAPGDAILASVPGPGELLRIDLGSGKSERLAVGLDHPTQVASATDGSIVVLEAGVGHLLRIDGAGTRKVIASGLLSPVGLTLSGGRWLVAEPVGGRILAIREGVPPVVVASGLAGPVAVAADRGGRIFVAEGASGRILRLEADRARTEVATGLALRSGSTSNGNVVPMIVDDDGAVIVACPGDGSILRITPP